MMNTVLQKKKNRHYTAGFSLLEMVVAVAVFSIAIIINASTLLILSRAQEHAAAFQNLQDNMRFALDSMTKSMLVGKNYRCFPGGLPDPPGLSTADLDGNGDLDGLESANDCSTLGGVSTFAYQSFPVLPASPLGRLIVYRLNGGKIERSVNNSNFIPVTDSVLQIDRMMVYITGVPANDQRQPKATILIHAFVPVRGSDDIELNMEASVSQRRIDT